MKKLTFMFVVMVLGLIIFCCCQDADFHFVQTAEAQTTETTTSEDYIPSETTTLSPIEVERVKTNDISKLKELMSECKDRKKNATKMKEAALALGYDEDNQVVVLAEEEWNNANADYKYYKNKYDKAVEKEKWNEKASKYPTAAYVWKYFKNKGYSDYVCAGIIGNLMAEVGGQTLSINATTTGHGYYGMCQWNMAYNPNVVNKNLEGQCTYLYNTIKKEFNIYGKKYGGYDGFLSITNEQTAAVAFASSYERCGSASYSQRMKNATIAYNYFVGN